MACPSRVLAIIRIFAWDWSPDFLGFSTETTVDEVNPRNKSFEKSLAELEIALCWSSIPDDALA